MNDTVPHAIITVERGWIVRDLEKGGPRACVLEGETLSSGFTISKFLDRGKP